MFGESIVPDAGRHVARPVTVPSSPHSTTSYESSG